MNFGNLRVTLAVLICGAACVTQAELALQLTERECEWNTQYVYQVASDRDAGVPESQAQSAFTALVATLPDAESRDSYDRRFRTARDWPIAARSRQILLMLLHWSVRRDMVM